MAVGSAQNDVFGQHAVLWNADPAHTIVDLDSFADEGPSYANGISNRGKVVGMSYHGFHARPLVWDETPAHNVFELPIPPGDNSASAHAINDADQILGLSYTHTVSSPDVVSSRLVLWHDGVAYPLSSLLDPAFSAWQIVDAPAINDAGQVAAAATIGGHTHPVLLTPLP